MGKNKKKSQNAGGAGKAKVAPTPPAAPEPEMNDKVHVGEDLVTGESIVIDRPSESTQKVLVTVEDASVVNTELVEGAAAIPDEIPDATLSKGKAGTTDDSSSSSAPLETQAERMSPRESFTENQNTAGEPAKEEQKSAEQPVSTDSLDSVSASSIPAPEHITDNADSETEGEIGNPGGVEEASSGGDPISSAEEVKARSDVQESAEPEEAASPQLEDAGASTSPAQHEEEAIVSENVNTARDNDVTDDLFAASGPVAEAEEASAYYEQVSSNTPNDVFQDAGVEAKTDSQRELQASAGEVNSNAPTDLFAASGSAGDVADPTTFFDEISSFAPHASQGETSEPVARSHTENVATSDEHQDTADDLFGSSEQANGDADSGAFFNQVSSARDEAAEVPAQQRELQAASHEVKTADDATDLFGDEAEDARVHEFEIAVEHSHAGVSESDAAPKTTEAAGSEDLFGQSANDDDLFGNEWAADGSKDDLFGEAQVAQGSVESFAVSQNGNQEDDLFGPGAGTQETEDLFGATATADFTLISEPTDQKPQLSQPGKQRVEDMDLDAAGVPQGWVDEQGGWNWYSAEERLDVARGMFGEVQDEAQNQPQEQKPVSASPIDRYSAPQLPPYVPTANNAYQSSGSITSGVQASTSAYDPYQPSVPVSASTSAYTPHSTNAYVPFQQQPTLAHATASAPLDPISRTYSPYDPPAAVVSQATANIYKPAAPVITATSPYAVPSSANTIPARPAPPPALNRMKTSTAYDPPMIPMAKALSRPASAAPVITPFGAPTLPPYSLANNGPSNAYSVPPGVTPPPVGPPRGPSRVTSPANVGLHSAFSPPPRKPQQAPSALAHPMVPNAYDPPTLPVMPSRPASRVATSNVPGSGMLLSPTGSVGQQMNVLPPPPPRSAPTLTGQPRGLPGVAHPPSTRTATHNTDVTPGLPRIQAEPPTPNEEPQQRPVASPPSTYAPPPAEHAYRAPARTSPAPPSSRTPQAPPLQVRANSPLSYGIPPPNHQAPPFSRPSSGMDIGQKRPQSADALSVHYLNENLARMNLDGDSEGARDARSALGAGHNESSPLEARQLPSHTGEQNIMPEPDAADPEGGAFDLGEEDQVFTQYSAQSAKPRPALQPNTFVPESPISQPNLAAAQAVSYDPYAPKPQTGVNTSTYAPRIPSTAAPPAHSSIPMSDPYTPYAAEQHSPFVQTPSSRVPAPVDIPAPLQAPSSSLPIESFGHSSSHSLSHSAYDPVDGFSANNLDEDPLGRSAVQARRVPSVSFGPRGTFVVAFQRDSEEETSVQNTSLAYGDDSKGLPVHIRQLADSLPPPIEQSGSTPWPGPLLTDPQASKTSAAEKKKREALNAFLAERIQEIESGLPYLTASGKDVVTRANQEAMMLLYQVAQLMLKHDGKILTSDPTAHTELKALLPKLSSSLPKENAPTSEVHGVGSASDTHFLSESLLKGDPQAALQYAMDRHLWSHALLLAAGIDPATWTSTVSAFVKATVRSSEGDGSHAVLATAYSIYGQGGPAVVESIPADDLPGLWRNSLATIVASSKPNDATYIIALAEKLKQHGLIKAAHLCYMLSPVIVAWQQSRPDSPLALVGSSETDQQTEATWISEILEYAIWLRPVAKGAEIFQGVPGLLQYKLNKAATLYATGDVAQAKRYCDAVVASLRTRKVPDPASQRMKLQLQCLLSRINGEEFNVASAKGLPKPKLENLGSWFEGTLTKFIAGDEMPSTDAKASGHSKKSSSGSAGIGPFSHFSAITPESTPALPSRAMSSYDIPGSASYSPPTIQRSGSAMSYRPQPAPTPTTQQRPTSAMAYRQPDSRLSALSQVSTNAEETVAEEFAGEIAPVHSTQQYQPDAGDTYKPAEEQPAVEIPSWGQSYTFEDTNQQESASGAEMDTGSFINPMANFITPAASMYPSAAPTPPAAYESSGNRHDNFGDEDEDDLGLGNSSTKKKPTPAPEAAARPAAPASGATSNYAPPPPKESPAVETKDEPEKPKESPKPAASGGSWLGRLWGKGGAEAQTTGPVRAKLGNESSMYYDKELKRWVTKGAVPEAPKATPPPPRAAATPKPATPTTVPSPGTLSAQPPSSRPSSAIPPPITPGITPLRSAPGTPGMATPPSRPASSNVGDPPLGNALALPPAGAARKGTAGKKNIRSRYVEIT